MYRRTPIWIGWLDPAGDDYDDRRRSRSAVAQAVEVLSEADITTRFDRLQRKLTPLWASMRRITSDEQTIVVVPSISLDAGVHGVRMQSLEERFLFLLLLLRQPRARLIYVTSQAIYPEVVDYYLDLLPGVFAGHAKKRLFLVSPLDGSAATLTEKLLARPRLIEHIRSLILDPDRAHLVPYNTTDRERELAVRLGIPMYGADPRCFHLGTKSGARKVFAEEGVPHPLGVEDVRSLDSLAEAICELRRRKPSIARLVTKLNEGVSGDGNANVNLSGLPAPGAAGEREAVLACVRQMRFESPAMTLDRFAKTIGEYGGIVEERIEGREFRSPSAQLRVTPLGDVEALSTHDQMLGGPSGQAYLGCKFPASEDYAAAIMREALKVGHRLKREGVLGRFALDFVAVRNERGEWEAYAIEINLRKGGTTHPFLTLQFLTDGAYDADAGVFRTPRGEPKCFVASDHVDSPYFRVFTHEDLFDIVARHGLHFDQSRQTGIVLHMINGVAELGSFGLTAVAGTRSEADALYQKAVRIFEAEAEQRSRGGERI
ncbi:MAG TPA: peptide ligase PGM1-related protein [Vicinamibacterales bacterium]|nr:peptide ligase PGM1-related protein [Vicinamibacterales bacterium]